jgi:transcriptional regulator NrdR family protein
MRRRISLTLKPASENVAKSVRAELRHNEDVGFVAQQSIYKRADSIDRPTSAQDVERRNAPIIQWTNT